MPLKKFSTWPHWLKGGIIFSLIYLVLLILFFIFAWFLIDMPPIIDIGSQLIFIYILFLTTVIFDIKGPWPDPTQLIVASLLSFIPLILLGIIFGRIYGKIKSKK